jgi:RsiW-degrading membrane proteinase PrsW (M82 family)
MKCLSSNKLKFIIMLLILIALAPVFIILFYVYFRDKYEHEPLGLLIRALLAGGLITIPIYFIELGLSSLGSSIWDASSRTIWSAFVVAGATEELFKFLALYILIWANRNFNEKFDGIVYAVFISLGFALVENIIYVVQGGTSVGWMRALTAVPAHALFGIVMGYYFGLAKFLKDQRTSFMIRAIMWPIILHGFYNYCLMSQIPLLMMIFIPFIIYLWISGFKKMKEISDSSRFRKKRV